MTYTTTSKFTRQLVGEIVKPAGAWRVDADPTFHDRMAALNTQYPQGEWEGNVHEGYKLYATVASIVDDQPLANLLAEFDEFVAERPYLND